MSKLANANRLTAHEAAEALRWWRDAGVDLALDETPHDRFAESAAPAARRAPAPVAASAPRAADPRAADPPKPASALTAPPDEAQRSAREAAAAARTLEGQLTATVHGTPEDLGQAQPLLRLLERKAGRLIVNGFPTGVEVCPSMHHGGPYPSTTDVRFTSVGTAALYRFVRPICYQDFPPALLPDALKDENPLGIWRLVNGKQVS